MFYSKTPKLTKDVTYDVAIETDKLQQFNIKENLIHVEYAGFTETQSGIRKNYYNVKINNSRNIELFPFFNDLSMEDVLEQIIERICKVEKVKFDNIQNAIRLENNRKKKTKKKSSEDDYLEYMNLNGE